MDKAKILIVEDNFIVMMELKDRLVEMGYDVVDSAAAGLEAIDKVGIHRPDLTMMDIRLKGEMDGIEAAGIIKKEYGIPVIYLTAHTDDDTLQRAKLTEPYGYIIKPFEERELRSAIEMALYKHKMEKRLKESEHWLSATLRSIGDALIATDSKGIIKLINPIAEEITGWKHQFAFGTDIKDVFTVKDGDNFLENPVIASLENNTIVGEIDKILVSKDGRETPVDFSSAPIRDEKNSIAGIVLVFRDITERKKAKELLEQQRTFLRHIIDTDPNYITVKDSKGRFELTNKAVAEALGTTTEEIVGRNDSDYFTNEEIEYQRKVEVDVINSKDEIFVPEEKLIDFEGRVHLVQTFRRAIDNQNGDQKLVLSIASDITELKLTEKTLRESEERIKTLLRAIPDIVLRINVEGSIIDYHIQESDHLFNTAIKIIGENICDVLDSELIDKIKPLIEKAIYTNEVQIIEFESNRDHEPVYKEIRLVNSAKDEFIVILRDVTQHKKAQKEIERYLAEVQNNKNILEQKANELADLNYKLNESEKELRALNASKDKFFSIIAHDLRSPFNALLGLSNYLVDGIEDITKDELKVISESILSSAKVTFSLLENLLQWARIKTGRITFNPEKINLKKVLNETIHLYKSNASNKEISLSLDLSSNDIIVHADLNMLETILRNLVSNSIKFTPRSGRVNIAVENGNNYIKINVIDTGIGINQDKMEKLFQIGENISTIGTDYEEGSGLGLILCKEFVELNKGSITVKSKSGEGSEFSFTLPKEDYTITV